MGLPDAVGSAKGGAAVRLLALNQILISVCVIITVGLITGLRKRIEELERKERENERRERWKKSK